MSRKYLRSMSVFQWVSAACVLSLLMTIVVPMSVIAACHASESHHEMGELESSHRGAMMEMCCDAAQKASTKEHCEMSEALAFTHCMVESSDLTIGIPTVKIQPGPIYAPARVFLPFFFADEWDTSFVATFVDARRNRVVMQV